MHKPSFRFSRQVAISESVVCNDASGVTLVELLIVVVITSIVAVGLSFAISASLRFNQQYREESYVRERLCDVLEWVSDYLSMANAASVSNGVWSGSAQYRMETGGVSFETGRVCRVTGTAYAVNNMNMDVEIDTGDPQWNGVLRKVFAADGVLSPVAASITEFNLFGTNAFRTLAVKAEYSVKTADGVQTNSITVSRPVRLWNL